MIIRRIFFGLICLSWACGLQAQESQYLNYTVNEGLAGDVVYDIVQGKDGFIWIATGSGVSRFDGVQFTNYSQGEGLPSGEIIKMYADRAGRVWFLTMTGELGFVFQNNFYNRKNHPEIAKIKAHTYHAHFFEDSKGVLWISQHQSGVYRIEKTDRAEALNIERIEAAGKNSYYGFWEEKGKVWLWAFKELLAFHQGKLESRRPFFPEFGGIMEIFQSPKGRIFFRNLSFLMELFPSMDKMDTLISFPQPWAKTGFAPINSLFQDKKERVWLAKNNGIIRLGMESGSPDAYLFSGRPVSSVLEDREGNLWIGSLKQGLFFRPVQALQLSIFGTRDGLPYEESICIERIGNRLFFGFGNGFLTIRDEGKFKTPRLPKEPEDHVWVRTIASIDSEKVWFGGDHNLLLTLNPENLQVSNLPNRMKLSSIKDLVKDKEGYVYVAWSRGCHRVYLGADTQKQGKGMESVANVRCNALTMGPESKIWGGSSKGVGKIENGKWLPWDSYPQLRGQSIEDLGFDRQGRLWIAVHGNGLFVEDQGKLHHINQKAGLLSNNCKKIHFHREAAWIATNLGINRVEFNGGQPRFQTYTRLDGLPSNDVNDIEIFQDTVWAATREGIARFPHRSVIDSLPPPQVYLTGIQVNDSLIPDKKLPSLSYRENNLRLDLIALSFQSQGQLTYRYKMLGLHNAWHESSNGTLNFEGLQAGSYELQVLARGYKTRWSQPKSLLSFTISPPFWWSPWFLGLIVALLLSLLLLIWRGQKRRTDRRNEISLLLASSEQKALRAQMNPHFIFNCLNSIQMFIMDNAQEEAYDYLQKFGSLIRRILEHSRMESVSLGNELETLGLYLALENLRFDQPLEYKIEVAAGIDPDALRIPSMLIQPYVENALIHGLSTKEGKRKLDIGIAREGGVLVCNIVDNGIGQKAAAVLQQKRSRLHTSIGQSATGERLKILNARRGRHESLSVQIHDLYLSDGSPAGTHVQIFIPPE